MSQVYQKLSTGSIKKVDEKIFCCDIIGNFVVPNTIYSKLSLEKSLNMRFKNFFSTALPVEMWKKPDKINIL